jgi:hypothetical protein
MGWLAVYRESGLVHGREAAVLETGAYAAAFAPRLARAL